MWATTDRRAITWTSPARRAPRASSPGTDPTSLIFNYDQAEAFSKFNAGTLRVNKRLCKGIALGANYQYSHSIDDAGSVGGTSTVVAQNWQNLAAEEGNSSFDMRHKVSGTYLYELPFGKDKFWVTSGAASHILEGFSVSGSFTFATGTPLTPSYQAASPTWRCGTAGTLRPESLTGSFVDSGRRLAERVVQSRGLSRSLPDTTLSATALAMPRATRLPGRERFRTTCRSRRPCSWAIRAAWRFAPRPTMSSIPCSIGRGHQRGFADLRAGDFGRLHAVVSVYGEVQVLAMSVSKSASQRVSEIAVQCELLVRREANDGLGAEDRSGGCGAGACDAGRAACALRRTPAQARAASVDDAARAASC